MSDFRPVSSSPGSLILSASNDTVAPIGASEVTSLSPLFIGNKVITLHDNSSQHQQLLEGINAAKEKYSASIVPDSSKAALQKVDTLVPKNMVEKKIIHTEARIAKSLADDAQQKSEATLKILNRVRSHLATDPEKLQQASALVSKAEKAATQARFIAGIVPHSSDKKIANFCAKLTAFDQAEAALSFAKLSLIEAELASPNERSNQEVQLANASRNLETIFDEIESLGVELKRSPFFKNEDAPHAKLMEALLEEVILVNEHSKTWRDVSEEEAKLRFSQPEEPEPFSVD